MKKRILGGALGVALCLGFAPHVSADAATAPVTATPAVAQRAGAKAVSFTLSSSQVSAGSTMTVTVASSGLKKKAKVILERTAGTENKFIKVTKLASSGAKVVATPPQGVAQFRITVKKKNRKGKSKVLARTAPQTVYSYADVSLSTLCGSSDKTSVSCESGTVPVGSSVFTYSGSRSVDTSADSSTAITAAGSSCRSATVDWALANDRQSTDVTAVTAVLKQEAADQQLATTPTRTVGSASFNIGSPSWNLAFTVNARYAYVYYRATLSCYTPTGDA